MSLKRLGAFQWRSAKTLKFVLFPFNPPQFFSLSSSLSPPFALTPTAFNRSELSRWSSPSPSRVLVSFFQAPSFSQPSLPSSPTLTRWRTFSPRQTATTPVTGEIGQVQFCEIERSFCLPET